MHLSFPDHLPLLAGAGLLPGAMNGAAGGGSFVTLPSLVFAGVPSVTANASSTVALLPGSVASTIAYRHDFKSFEGIPLWVMLAVSLFGGLVGAGLLLATPQRAFDLAVPWLLLFGTIVFAGGRTLATALARLVRIRPGTLVTCQFLLAIYGGYFGGAVGLMMLAAWSLLGLDDLKALNASRTLLVGATNAVAAAFFITAGAVVWPQTLTMLVAAVLGGYAGARLARRLDAGTLRIGINIVNASMTALVFLRTFG